MYSAVELAEQHVYSGQIPVPRNRWHVLMFKLHSGALSLLPVCRFQGWSHRKRAGSDASFEKAARVASSSSSALNWPPLLFSARGSSMSSSDAVIHSFESVYVARAGVGTASVNAKNFLNFTCYWDFPSRFVHLNTEILGLCMATRQSAWQTCQVCGLRDCS